MIGDLWSVVFSVAFLASVVRVVTPVLFAATGGLISEVAGVPNIVLEGAMLAGACAGGLCAGYTSNTGLGLLAAIAAGTLVGLGLGVMHLDLGADAIISGIGINLLVAGTTVFAVYSLTGDKSGSSTLGSNTLPVIDIPLVERIPVVGGVVSGQNVLTYAAFAAWLGVAIMLKRARFGTHLLAAGEAPDAARSVGLDVRGLRYAAVAASGALSGCGGAFLSMGSVSYFVRDMTAGRGFIAVAAIFLGAKKPVGTLLACLLFASTEALAIRLGNFDVPSQLVSAIPYATTFVALGLFARKKTRERTSVTAPATSGSSLADASG